MIGALLGTVFQNDRNPIILLSGSVGYTVYIPERLRIALKTNTSLTLFIHTHVRDDAIELFGFTLKEELNIFELLITVSGIGPKTAMLVADRGVPDIEKAIRDADVDFFTTIPRLGKKNAQKIIIELKTKLGSLRDIDLQKPSDGETRQLIDVLVNMGFARNEIILALKQLDSGDTTIEKKLRHCLRILGKS